MWLIFFPTAFRYCKPGTERRISAFPPDCIRADHRSGRNPGTDETVLGRKSRLTTRLPRNQEDYEQDFNQQRNVCRLYLLAPLDQSIINFPREKILITLTLVDYF